MVMVILPSQLVSEALRICCGMIVRAGVGQPKVCRYPEKRGLFLGGQMEKRKTGELCSSEWFHCISRLFFFLVPDHYVRAK